MTSQANDSRKVVLITGAGRGLGRAVAERLAADGWAVVVNFRSSAHQAADLALRLGSPCISLRADVSVRGDVEKMIAQIDDRFGRLDAVVNNAGITRDRLLLRQTEEDWDAVMTTNLKGAFTVIRAAAPLMIRAGGGQIINISSYSGLKGKAGQAAYSASKAALFGLSLTAAAELAEFNIRVNAVLPGYFATGMGSAAPEAMEEARSQSILKTLAQPGTAADFIAWLLRSTGITGQIFSLDSRIR